MTEQIINVIFEYKSEIISAFIALLAATIYSKFSSIIKKFPKALNYIGGLTLKQIVKSLCLYILPLIFILGFIFLLRDRVVTFGIIGLFIIVCSMYLIVIFLIVIGNIMSRMYESMYEKLKIEKDFISGVEMGFKDVYTAMEQIAKNNLENKNQQS